MPDILIRGYKAKEQIEEIIQEARYAMNNSMVGSGLEIIELPPHGDLILKDDAIVAVKLLSDLYPEYRKILAILWDQIKDAPVIVPASEEATNDPKP